MISGKLGFPVVQPRLNFLPRVSPLVQPRLNFRAATSAGTCLNSRTVGAVDGGVYLLVGSTCRGSMATLDMDCVHKYIHHITDVTPPKAEYVRHFEAHTPRALDGRYVLTGGPSPSHAFAEMEAWSADHTGCQSDHPDCRWCVRRTYRTRSS